MKKLYTILTIAFLTHISFGQDIAIVADDDHQNYAGQTISIVGDDNILNRLFYAKNIGTTSTFYWSRTILNSSSQDFIIQLCDDMICYNTSGSYWIGPEKTIDPGDSLIFKPQITTSGNSGSAEVRYYVLDGNKDKIDSLTVQYTSTLSTNQQQKNEFSIFPNPAKEVITIKGDQLKNGDAIVFLDALGKEVKRTTMDATNNKIDIASLKRGVYFVSIYNQNGVKSKTQRLIKQ